MICVPGNRACTASARICAKSWRAISSASASSRLVTKASCASTSIGRMISRNSPSTRAAIAAFARPGPIAAAISAGVVPRATSRAEPSGRVTRIISDMDLLAFNVVRKRPFASPRAKSQVRRNGSLCTAFGCDNNTMERLLDIIRNYSKGNLSY